MTFRLKMGSLQKFSGDSDDEPKDLREFIDQVSRLSFNEDFRPDSVMSFRPPSVAEVPALDLSGSSSDTLDAGIGPELSEDDEQPDSGLGPSGCDDSVVTSSKFTSPELTSTEVTMKPTPPVKSKKSRKKKKTKEAVSKKDVLVDVLPPVQLQKKMDPALLMSNASSNWDPFLKSESPISIAPQIAKKEDLLTARTTSCKQLDPLILQKKVDKCFEFVEEASVSDWLTRANKNALALRQWCSVPNQFVDFTQFWLVSFIESQRVELFAMEHEILIEELTVGFAQGLDTKNITKDDLNAVLCVAFSEYPDKFFGTHGNKFFIDTLVLLMTGNSYNYKKLLSAVRFSSTDKTKLQIVLSIRVFAIFNYFNAILEFFQSYRKLNKVDLCDFKRISLPPLDSFIKEVVSTCLEKDALATLAYFVIIHKFNPNAKDDQQRSLLFRAVVAHAINCVSWLVKNVTTQTLNMPSESGNTCLHTAVSLGNIAVARVLLSTSGIKVDVANPQAGGMTPLGLAVFQGHHSACRLLLTHGANPKASAPSLLLGEEEPVPLAQFALDLGHPQISLLLENFEPI